jgi:hypothetical protein
MSKAMRLLLPTMAGGALPGDATNHPAVFRAHASAAAFRSHALKLVQAESHAVVAATPAPPAAKNRLGLSLPHVASAAPPTVAVGGAAISVREALAAAVVRRGAHALKSAFPSGSSGSLARATAAPEVADTRGLTTPLVSDPTPKPEVRAPVDVRR